MATKYRILKEQYSDLHAKFIVERKTEGNYSTPWHKVISYNNEHDARLFIDIQKKNAPPELVSSSVIFTE